MTHSNRDLLIQFLATIKRPDLPMDRITDNDGLIKSGLIDSLAMLEIIAFLESRFGIDFSETGVDPVDLESIQKILDLIDRYKQ
ncbi:MAG: acyl carrier protein [Magnetococcales bacterium]|nr:acyl carrier protein [Magnetococcales bacterium]NGZ04893.1 acyl carrier protein [Magnetococcales bacterium]